MPPARSLRPVGNLEPVERWIPLGLRLLVIGLSGLLLYQAASSTYSFPPGAAPFLFSQWSWWIITPLHEGGHFLFFFFGRTLYIFGGSFWQIMFPVLLAIVAFRKRSFWTTLYVTLTGVHLIHLNPYIYDAPYRTLPLLGGKKVGHDWYNLLIHYQALDLAEPLSELVYFGGIVVGVLGIVSGVVWAVMLFRNPPPLAPLADAPVVPRFPRQ